MLELLSPAGSVEAVRAAVQNGADAVYLGYGDFNARRNAKNFTREEFAAAVSYCHLRGCRVYLTLNTLLTDRELPAAARCAAQASELGVDAVLVQDLGVVRMLGQVCPDLPVHASTQMTVHSLDGVKQLADLGMTRAVLSRELSRDAIAFICARSPIEIEVFGHGALCMCYSGQCFFSSVIGGRSGNRGLCAQPCRLNYGWNGRADGHPLSLKDMSLAGHLRELEEMGVACLKLEGRMKRPEYVAIVTQVYAAAIRERREPTAGEVQALTGAFSRQGFTDGYFMDQKTPAMFGVREEQAEPKALFAQARQSYERGEAQRVPVAFTAQVRRGAPIRLEARDGQGHAACAEGPVPEEARTRAVGPEEVKRQLSRTGGTPFFCAAADIAAEEGLSVPAAALNALRREALEKLSDLRLAPPARRRGAFCPGPRRENRREGPALTLSVCRAGQITPALLALKPALVYVPVEELAAHPELAGTGPLAAILPRVAWDREQDGLIKQLERVRAMGIADALIGNLGMLSLAREMEFVPRGDYGLGVYNSLGLEALRTLGLRSATVSFELRLAQIRDLSKAVDTELIAYGRLPLMLTEHCLLRSRDGGVCRRSCEAGENTLTDRRGAPFPVARAYGCRNEILNSRPLYLADKGADCRQAGVWAQRLVFTLESPEECVRVAQRYLGHNTWEPEEYTRGLYYREVE